MTARIAAGALEPRLALLEGVFGFDVGSLLATWEVPNGTLGFSPMPTVNMYLGYAF